MYIQYKQHGVVFGHHLSITLLCHVNVYYNVYYKTIHLICSTTSMNDQQFYTLAEKAA